MNKQSIFLHTDMLGYYSMGNSVHELSQWEKTLHCNVVSHWPNPYAEWYMFVEQKPLCKVFQLFTITEYSKKKIVFIIGAMCISNESIHIFASMVMLLNVYWDNTKRKVSTRSLSHHSIIDSYQIYLIILVCFRNDLFGSIRDDGSYRGIGGKYEGAIL